VKRVLLFVYLLISVSCMAQIGTVVGQVSSQQLNPATTTTAQAGNITNPSSNFVINVSPGPIVCPNSGATDWVNQSQMTLAASQTYLIVYNCPLAQVYAKQAVTGPGSSGTTVGVPSSVLFAIPNVELNIATVVCGSTNCGNTNNGTITDNRVAGLFPIISDWVIPFGPGDCAWNASGTLGATTGLNLQAIGASFAMVNDISTTGAGATNDNLTCNLHVPQRTTAGHGFFLSDCTIYYGVQTTALTSLGNPTLNSITLPTPGAGETPSTVTPVTLGSVTPTPLVASANLATTTAGAFFSEKVALNTPVFINTDFQSLQFNQVFAQSAAAAQIVNTPGGVCHGSLIVN
jgi:hypothetical protein